MRSKHLWPTLQLTVRSKVKPVSITDKTNLSKLVEGFGLDSSPVLISMPLTLSSISSLPTSCSLPSSCFWLSVAPQAVYNTWPFHDS